MVSPRRPGLLRSLMLGLLASVLSTLPGRPAAACSCSFLTEQQVIADADLVFVGVLAEVQGDPAAPWPSGSPGPAAADRMELVFDHIDPIKGEPGRAVWAVDTTAYGNNCSFAPPDMRGMIGKRMRVALHRLTEVPDWIPGFSERWARRSPIYMITFSLCSHALAPPEGVPGRPAAASGLP